MPIYEYECLQCGINHEVMQKFSDEPITTCHICGGSMRKLLSKTSFVLKGTGWYVTDYASAERKKAMEAEKGKSENKSSESKISEAKEAAASK